MQTWNSALSRHCFSRICECKFISYFLVRIWLYLGLENRNSLFVIKHYIGKHQTRIMLDYTSQLLSVISKTVVSIIVLSCLATYLHSLVSVECLVFIQGNSPFQSIYFNENWEISLFVGNYTHNHYNVKFYPFIVIDTYHQLYQFRQMDKILRLMNKILHLCEYILTQTENIFC